MKPRDRWKKKVKRKTVSGSVTAVKEKKPSKHQCAACGGILHGMPHGKGRAKVGKMSKTEKRPSVLLAGQLCNSCRKEALEDCIQVQLNSKPLNEVDLKLKKFVLQLMNQVKA
ncbi:MAG: hypothetical protein V1847_05405 [Candidatus Diapherotrites archaeon]